MISPTDLTYFIEIAATENVSRAAERLAISQPSLSQAILRIEHEIGEPIFVRHKRGMQLTPAGKELLIHARALIESWNTIRTKSVASMQEVRGRYVIGCHPSVALYSLSGFLPNTLKKHPQLEIQLTHDLSRRITEGVISSRIDVGIVVNPVRHPDLIIQKIADDEVTFWQSQKRSNKETAASKTEVLICDPDLSQSQSLLKNLKGIPFEFSRTLTSGSLEVIADLTAAGTGIGILPTRVAGRARSPLVRIKGAPVFRDEICIIRRVETKKVAAVEYLCKEITRSFAQ